MTYRFNAQFTNFKSQVAAAQRSVNGFADDLTKLDKRGERMRRGLNDLGGAAGKMGLVAAGGLAAAGKAAIDWESQWAGVTKTVDGSSAQLQQLEGDLREMARTLPASHQEIAAVAEAAGQLGVQTESVAEFTETMIALGETTNLTAEEAATSIARFSNIMGTSANEVENIGSALVDLGNNSATTEAEILTLGTRLAAAGAIAGLSESDVLAFASTLTSVGVEAEAGGTALSKVFTSMRDAVIDGGENLETFASTAGLSASEFQQQWGDDPASAVNSFIQGLGRMNAAGESTSGVFDALSLTDQRLMRALLSTAESGDLLTESLNRGSDAYGENTALAEEFEKRLGTTESQITVAWNNIRDAGIEMGEVLLPIIAEVAEVVGGVAEMFGKLPGPVKTAVTALAGITAIFGGGLWFTARTVNGIATMNQAMLDLGASTKTANRATRLMSGAMKGLAIGAGIAAGLVVITAAAEKIRGAFDESYPGVNQLTQDLMDLQDGRVASLGSEFDSLGESVSRLTDKRWDVGASDAFGSFFGIEADSLHDATREVEALDEALANMATSAGPDAAADALQRLATAQGLTSDEFDRLKGLLPQYDEAVAGVENSERTAAAATDELGDAAAGAAPKIQQQEAALLEAREAANKTATSFFGLGDSVDDAEVSLGQWLKQLAKQAKALRDFRKNAEEAGNKGLRQGLISALRDAGPEGALRMRQLANATDAEIKRANKAWGSGQREVRKYTNEIGGVPSDVSTNVRLNGTGAAISMVASLREQIANIPKSTTAYVNVIRRGQMSGVNPLDPYGSADGTTVPKTGMGYADRHLYLLADGEEVISNRFGQADRHRDLLKAINGNRLADGGTASYSDAAIDRISTRPFSIQRDWLRALEQQAREFERALGRSEKALDKERSQREDLIRQRNSLSGSVTGRLRSDVFGSMDDVWADDLSSGGLSDLFSTLRGDIQQGVQFKRATRELRRSGLGDGALQAVLESGDPSDFAALSQRQLREFERLYNRRQRVTSGAGRLAGFSVFGDEIAAQTAEVKAQTAELKQASKKLAQMQRVIEKQQERIESGVRDGARTGTREGISERNRRNRQRVGNS